MSSRRTFRCAVLNLPAFQLVMYTSTVLLMWFGGNMILRGQLQVGELTGFLSYVMQVMNSLMMISNVFLLADTFAGQRQAHRRSAGRAGGPHIAAGGREENCGRQH